MCLPSPNKGKRVPYKSPVVIIMMTQTPFPQPMKWWVASRICAAETQPNPMPNPKKRINLHPIRHAHPPNPPPPRPIALTEAGTATGTGAKETLFTTFPLPLLPTILPTILPTHRAVPTLTLRPTTPPSYRCVSLASKLRLLFFPRPSDLAGGCVGDTDPPECKLSASDFPWSWSWSCGPSLFRERSAPRREERARRPTAESGREGGRAVGEAQ